VLFRSPPPAPAAVAARPLNPVLRHRAVSLALASPSPLPRPPQGNGKLYNILTNLVVSCASLAYLVMALGGTAVPTLNARAFLWVRYADWLVTTPLLLIDLGLLVGAPLLEIGWVVAMDVLMVVAGFAGAISTGTNAAWPLLAIGCLFFLPVLHALVASFAESAKAKGAKTFALYSKLAVLLGVTWTAYPIIWGVSEGAQSESARPRRAP
jgi:bacteriorhodopsin